MSAVDIPAITSEAMAEIYTHRQKSFRHLASNKIKKSVMDQFESYLARPGTLSRPSLIVRCQVAHQNFDLRIVVDKRISQWRLAKIFLPFMKRLVHRTSEPAEFFVLISDSIYVSEQNKAEFREFLKNIPFLRCDQRTDDEISSHAILIPDFSLQDTKYAEELARVEKASDSIAFEQRVEVIKWRGSLSGPDYPSLDNCRDFLRYALLTLSLTHSDIVDARLTNYDDIALYDSTGALRRHLHDTFGELAEVVPAEGFVPYKYLISLDGAVAAWKRVPIILASGSVLLLQHQWKQFFYPGLKPWRHYVPLKDDISDVLQKYEWLRSHPSEAKTIAQTGQSFAKEILNPVFLEAFFLDIVRICGELYDM